MVKKLHRFLAVLLALALVITTFGSDFANAEVLAVDGEEVEVKAATETLFEAIPEGESAAEIAASTEASASASTEETVEEKSEEVVSDASTEGGEAKTDEISEEEKSEEDETQKEGEVKPEDEKSEEAGEEASKDDTAVDASTEATTEAAAEASTEDEKKEKDAATEDASVIEKVFQESVTIDDIRISLFAEPGVLPADAVLKVEKVPVTQEEEIKDLIDEELGEKLEVQETFSFDINIYSESEGKFVQPEDGKVEVKFEEIEAAESEETSLAVFHVEDDLSDATKVASAGNDATEIKFDAEHFSIYTVTVYNVRYPKYASTIKIGVVDALYSAVDLNTDSFDIKLSSYNDVMSAEDLLNNITIPEGYEFMAFSANRQNFYQNHFIIDAIKLKDNGYYSKDSVMYKDKDGTWRDLYDGTIFVVCRKENQETTANHLDLGFERASFIDYVKKGARVYAVIDGVQHHMYVNREVYRDSFDGKEYYEFRYDSASPIAAESEIVFKVECEGKTYVMRCTTDKNLEAFTRCFRAHSSTQNSFGFDYICNFDEDFHLSSGVVYYKNDGSGASVPETLNWDSADEDATMTYHVKSFEDVFGENDDDTMIFLGWSETADGEVKYDKDAVDPTFIASNNTEYSLYAKWDNVIEGNVKVAVYATDGTNSRNADGDVVVNSALTDTLNLDYVQQDGYYPIGIVEVPASLFEELGYDDYFIRSDADWAKVCEAMTNCDASATVLQNGNVGNKVFDAIKSGAVQIDTNNGAGWGENHFKTAFFKWNRAEATAGSIVNPDEENFAYHLDLRFATNIVSYKACYYTGEEVDTQEDLDGKKAYLQGSNVPVEDSQDYVPEEKDDYVLEGLYTDEDCTKEYTGFTGITEDKVVYAKYVKKEKADVYFFLLAKNQKDKLKVPIAGHQPDADYYPEFNGSGKWSGTATNIDLLKDEWNYVLTKEENDGVYPYYAIYYWDGVEKHVPDFQYSYDAGVKEDIQECLDSNFNNSIPKDQGIEPFSVDDIVWYIYKKELNGVVANHIDGYVSANIVYDVNFDHSKVDGEVVTKPEVVMAGDKVTIKDNMFTLTDKDYVFVGWSTDPEGKTGVSTYKAGDEKKLDYKTVLYAQWLKIPDKKIKITIQADAHGDGADKTYKYDGQTHLGDLNVDVNLVNDDGSGLLSFLKNAVSKVLSFGVLYVNAAEPESDKVTKDVPVEKFTLADGTELIVSGMIVEAPNKVDVGTYDVDLNYKGLTITAVIDGKSYDVTDLFEIEYSVNGEVKVEKIAEGKKKDPEVIGKLNIIPREVIITSASASKAYDGTPLSRKTPTYKKDLFVKGEVQVTLPNSITNVGDVKNVINVKPVAEKYQGTAGRKLFNTNYTVSITEGTLSIYDGGDNPPPFDNPPSDDVPVTPVAAVLGATRPQGEVLGATREPAVLGARRGRTEDNTNTLAHILTILAAAGVAFAMIALRKKNEDEK